MKKRETKQPTFIAPERLYTLVGFQQAAGISGTRMREARRRGVTPTLLRVGRRIFIRGGDAISFVEALARAEGGTAS